MTEQLDLMGGATPLEKPILTDRQQYVHDELCRHPDGLNATEVGAILHEHGGRHDAGLRCDWCQKTGLEVLRALRKKGLAKSNRHGLWRALHTPAPAPENHGEIPF